jgi:hypothetical protein
VKVAIVADQPAHEGEEELAEGGVDIEEVGSLEVVGCKLSKQLVSYGQVFNYSESTSQDEIGGE